MKILGIETSCDDTAVSVIEVKKASPRKSWPGIKIFSSLVSSQEKLHAEYGGVFPSLAKREHQKNIVPLLTKALKEAGLLKKTKSKDEKKIKKVEKILERNPELFQNLKPFLENYEIKGIDKIAVTVGPGLEPCLWVGTNLAKALSFYFKKPVIKANHIEGHILSNWLFPIKSAPLPMIALIVSGGNTQMFLVKDVGKYKLIGETRDDAAGECFDKTARILGLEYPGGPEISKYAEKFKEKTFDIELPRPMIREKNFDFSFSGLKTAVLYDFKKRKNVSRKYVMETAYEIQEAIIEVLLVKTMRATEKYKAKAVLVGGGVSANKKLRKDFKQECEKRNLTCFFPEPKFSTDNAAMIALTAALSSSQKEVEWNKLKVNANLRVNGV
ncbi:MAG: tRNA (adenosine(37)-N6)-threonylcarbamoyltransferase complex transferase subunit TsaD [Candidatus Paceibacterota bacterium]|jgi:N6-L-threonylcarbamoyladenine synthase|nr:tRNA (adenosine(37)-N6)-threonylcarbamoyltransferase complex transferase subunit TsaD [Candidatus Paceibacterota bacterium]